MKLNKIDIEHFRNIVYPEYLKIFSEEERKSLELIELLYHKGIMNFIEITYKNNFIGFIIINIIDDIKYIQLDYFAILPNYQKKGYGTRVITMLKTLYSQYKGIFVEVEALSSELDKQDKEIKQRRINFYENLGFQRLNYEFKWFDSLILVPYILPISHVKEYDDIVLNNILNLYAETHGNKKLQKSLQVIKK